VSTKFIKINKEVKMMSIVMKFDTLAWSKKLAKAGIPSEQAEAHVEMLLDVIENNVSSKQDLNEIKKDIIIEVEKIKSSLKSQIAKWVLGVSALQTSLLIALIRSLH
jgi:argininosuccinate lyase